MSITIKLLSFFLFSSISLVSLCIPTVETYRVNKEQNQFHYSSKNQTVHFFCRISQKQKEEIYLEKFNLFFNKKEIQSIENLHFNLIFYEDINEKTKSVGLNVYFSDEENRFVINDFEVYFQNFNLQKLKNHQKRPEISKYYILESIREPDLVKIKIADVFCADLLADNIPQYKNYLSQFFNPSFSEKEEIESLKDSLKIIKSHLDSINKKLQLLEELLIPSKTVIKSNEKDGNKNKPKNKDVINENE